MKTERAIILYDNGKQEEVNLARIGGRFYVKLVVSFVLFTLPPGAKLIWKNENEKETTETER